MMRIGSSATMSDCCASIHPCSRSIKPLASSGSTAPLPYPVGRYSARTLLPSGLDHQNAVRCDVARHPAPHDCVGEAELTEDLWHLCDVPEHVGQVAHRHRAPEACGAVEAELQVADDRLARDEELVHEDVPGAHRERGRSRRGDGAAPRPRVGWRGSRRPPPSGRRAGSARTTGRPRASAAGRRAARRAAAGRSGRGSTTHGPSACEGPLPLASPSRQLNAGRTASVHGARRPRLQTCASRSALTSRPR